MRNKSKEQGAFKFEADPEELPRPLAESDKEAPSETETKTPKKSQKEILDGLREGPECNICGVPVGLGSCPRCLRTARSLGIEIPQPLEVPRKKIVKGPFRRNESKEQAVREINSLRARLQQDVDKYKGQQFERMWRQMDIEQQDAYNQLSKVEKDDFLNEFIRNGKLE